MTLIDHPRPRAVTRRTPRTNGRRPTTQLVSEGVVAGYLHDISTRNPRRRRRQAPAGAGPACREAAAVAMSVG